MQILFDTDKNIDGNDRLQGYMQEKISTALSRFSSHITRLEIHLADENGQRASADDKRCVLEAHVEGLRPIAVTGHAGEVEQAVNAAITKLKASLDTALGKLKDRG